MKRFFNTTYVLSIVLFVSALGIYYLLSNTVNQISAVKVLQSANVPITVIDREPKHQSPEEHQRQSSATSELTTSEIDRYVASQTKGYVTLTQAQYEDFSSRTSDPNLLRYLKKRRTYTEFENYIQARDLSEQERLNQGLALLEKLSANNIYEYLIPSEAYAARLSIIQMLPLSQMEKNSMITELETSMMAQAENSRAESPQVEDPRIKEYRTLEQNIILEIAALEEFPQDLSKQEYLEAKLQEARVAVYGQQ